MVRAFFRPPAVDGFGMGQPPGGDAVYGADGYFGDARGAIHATRVVSRQDDSLQCNSGADDRAGHRDGHWHVLLFSKLGIPGTVGAITLGHTIVALPIVVIIVSATLQGFDARLEQTR